MTMEYVMVLSFVLVSAAVVIWPATVICRRLGYSPYLGFLIIIPFANLVLLWFVAFSPWAIDQAKVTPARSSWDVLASLRSLRQRLQMIGLPQKP